MAGLYCAFNSATALRRVFIPSALEPSTFLPVTRIFAPALLHNQQKRTISDFEDLYKKHFNSGSGILSNPAYQKATREVAPKPAHGSRPLYNDKPGPRVKTKLARLPRDDEIREKFVYLKTNSPDGGAPILSEAKSVKSVLADLDRKTESLRVIRAADTEFNNPDALTYPVAEIVNIKKELARQQKQKEEAKHQKATNKEKELELNWAMDPHDIEHKMETLKKFLAKGYKVQVLLLKKGGKKVKPSKKQGQELLEKITTAVAAVEGSTEWKGREGKELGSMRVFVQGKLQEGEKQRQTEQKEKEKLRKLLEEERQMEKQKRKDKAIMRDEAIKREEMAKKAMGEKTDVKTDVETDIIDEIAQAGNTVR